MLTLVNGGNDASHHHCTNAHSEHSAKVRAIDWNDLSRVLSVNIQPNETSTSATHVEGPQEVSHFTHEDRTAWGYETD